MRTSLAAAIALALAATPLAQQGAKPADPADKDKKEPKWDVAADFGPTSKVAFDTSEGTWMNVDVSPDGQRVVFDLLGDLYVMPIGGSTAAAPATRLTSGPVFDMQPRFSPDGKRIAFTSDRGGLFNIWVMDADGRNPTAVSREEKWWVNSPTWAPDGDFIFARRHFVQTRSLGAGEIWMYHRSGADGVQVTEKVSFQKDAGEPALSPDGKFLYYSKDATPSPTFEYNKDPHAGIYAIVRRDLTTGRERTIVSGAGGAITPRVSPDGKWLAFIRRIDTGSQLFVRSIATGAERPIFARLDKDQQEAWSIFGPYAQYAWLPDTSGLVVWGEGKIWRVDLAAAAPAAGAAALVPGREIPFVAKVEQTVTEALRFPVAVAPDRFPVRMLRGAVVAPDGKHVVYSALGKLWLKSLPDGAPKRLTARDDIEYDPAFSPDGRTIAYASWRDVDRGRIRTIGLDGGGGREVVTTPGHYLQPSFSPDGRRLVFRAVDGDDVRGPNDGERPGIFVVGAEGGEPVLVREEGTRPRFNADGTRIFFLERRGDRMVLASVTTGNAWEIVHARSENATELVPSPDGRWVAFEERWRTYIAALPQSGRPIELSPTAKAFPVARVSRDSGWSLHWSTPHTLHWTLGADLYTRELSETFAFVGTGTEKPDEPEAKGVPIGFEQASDTPEGTIALVGARVITMAGGTRTVIDRGTIVVEGNRIAAVGPQGSVAVPAGARRIDVAGKTIIPGIVDAHAHVRGEGNGILGEQAWPLAANLAFGVTTSHDPSNDTQTVFTKSEMIRAGLLLGPRLYSTGTILYGAETPFKALVENYDDALMHIRRMKAVGAISVKSYNQQRRDTRQMILKAARAEGLMVVPEGGSLLYQNLTQITDGHTGVEHNLPVPRLYRDVITLFSKTKVGYTPTLIVGYGGLSGEFYWYQHHDVWKHARLQAFTPREVLVERSRRRTMAAEDDFNHVLIAKAAKALRDAGTSVQLGAHGQLQGLGAHWELWMLAQGGMTPLEALESATIAGARYLGMDTDVGSLEKGKLADLVVLDRNPLENIRNTDSVRSVMVNGRLYDAATLDELAPRARKRPPFWWQRR